MNTEQLERTEELRKVLHETGITVNPYVKAPINDSTFAVTLDRSNVLRYWLGLAEIDLRPDKSHRQAVMNVTENAREVTQQYTVNSYRGYRYHDGELLTRNDTVPALQEVQNSFPVVVPNGRISNWKILESAETTSRWRPHRVEATMKAPATFVPYLVGFDERRQFISQLPDRARSVEQAHKLLKPTGMRPGWKRQGEWFFVPVTKVQRETIRAMLEGGTVPRTIPLEVESTHVATTIGRSNTADWYCMGVVQDRRTGRHAPLVLDDWHQIRRNLEVVQPKTARTRYYD